jgi:hypothetical protein
MEVSGFTFQLHYVQGKNPGTYQIGGTGVGLDIVTKKERNPVLLETEPWSFGHHLITVMTELSWLLTHITP